MIFNDILQEKFDALNPAFNDMFQLALTVTSNKSPALKVAKTALRQSNKFLDDL